ncbi:DUF2252 family protein [Bradyrhizobium sp. CIAT3101]|uniref:DUF2252 family protein n=1 Tax=Bradyrhizobium sp. CIAT3101 TaxID=439387 RepID=UPI0024B1656B|nr:DUF2252 family protein [Bradyrhizobium sp. CIAT3101]WFU80759.1 DUF2252 family protein [Bradyrhizobium sp. CIAT3101]
MSFVDVNASYETWMRTQCEVVEKDLERKHERMKESPFLFFRATFFRWRHMLSLSTPELFDLPAPFAVGDSHVENFGTWRDAEQRLVWERTIMTTPTTSRLRRTCYASLSAYA